MWSKKVWLIFVMTLTFFITRILVFYDVIPQNIGEGIEVFTGGTVISVLVGRTIGKVTERLGVHDLIVEFFEDFVVVVGILFSFAGLLGRLGFDASSIGLSISAFVGFLVSFGFKDLLTNISAGAWISVIEPFEIGDRVKVGGYVGVVEEMNATNIVLRGDDGERVVIPAKNAWNTPIVKYERQTSNSS